MILLLSIAACVLTAFIVIALAFAFGGPDPLREQELQDLADAFVLERHIRRLSLMATEKLQKENDRLNWVIEAQGKMIDEKNDLIEVLSNVVNDRTGRGGFGGLGGH